MLRFRLFNTGGDMLNITQQSFQKGLVGTLCAKASLVLLASASFAAFGLNGAMAQSAAAPAAVVGNAAAGAQKNSMCIGCHGIPHYKTAFPVTYRVPKIGGQSQAYLEAALKAYRSGDRPHPSMTGIAKALSDQDIADLAAYYANQK
jgi:cytochrome c553